MRVSGALRTAADLSKHRAAFSAQHKFAHLYQQPVEWGDLDSFQHVNNVRYLRYFESARMQWLQQLALEAGGEVAAYNLLKGRGVGLILKKIDVDFKRPVSYPDTLLIAHKFLPKPDGSDPAHLLMQGVAYSVSQHRIVTQSNAVCVWYDYEKLQKALEGPPASMAAVIDRSIQSILDKPKTV